MLSIATHYVMFNTTVTDGRRFSELYKYYFININYLTFNSLHAGSLNIGLRGTISLCGKPNNRLVKWNSLFTAKLTSFVNLGGKPLYIKK